MRIWVALSLSFVLSSSDGRQDTPSPAARALELTVPIQAKVGDKTAWLSGTLVHVSGTSGLVAYSLPRLKARMSQIEGVTFTCLLAERSAAATSAGRFEPYEIGFLAITADGLPKTAPAAPDPMSGLVPGNAKLFASGLADPARSDRSGTDANVQMISSFGSQECPGTTLMIVAEKRDMDPCGGPVLDSEGRLAGVTVKDGGSGARAAAHTVLSGSAVERLVSGAVVEWKLAAKARDAETCVIQVEAEMCNPLGRVREARAAHFARKVEDRVNGVHPEFVDAGLVGPAHPLMKETGLKIEGDRISGEISLSKKELFGLDCVIQVRLLRSGTFSFYTRPRFLTPEFTAASAAPPAGDDWMESDASRKRDGEAKAGKLVGRRMTNVDSTFTRIELPADEIVADPAWDRAGKSLFILQKKGLLSRIAVPSFDEERTVDLGFECASMRWSLEGIVIQGKGRPELVVVDPSLLEVKRKIPIQVCHWVAASPRSALAIASIFKEPVESHEVQIVDLASGSLVATQPLLRNAESGRGRVAAPCWQGCLSPDGRTFLGWDRQNQLLRHRLSGSRLILEETRSLGPPGTTDDWIHWSPDSLYFSLPQAMPAGREMQIYRTSNLQQPLFRLNNGGWGPGFAFDPQSKRMFGPGGKKPLAVYDSNGGAMKEYALWPEVDDQLRFMIVHPEGRRALAVGRKVVAWIEFPR